MLSYKYSLYGLLCSLANYIMDFSHQTSKASLELSPKEIVAVRNILNDTRTVKHPVTIPVETTFTVDKDTLNRLITVGSCILLSNGIEIRCTICGTGEERVIKILDPPCRTTAEVLHVTKLTAAFTNGDSSMKKIAARKGGDLVEHQSDGWVIATKYPLEAYADHDKDNVVLDVVGYLITARDI